ncbi:hypothetical protein PTNB73_03269 [Pyrenophora teres f. teres]|nr:hypothetical protein PTNB73_03269 [Pyrenophora teres f. teres]
MNVIQRSPPASHAAAVATAYEFRTGTYETGLMAMKKKKKKKSPMAVCEEKKIFMFLARADIQPISRVGIGETTQPALVSQQ